VTDWREELIHAAAKRRRVRLRNGRIGVIVYAPSTRAFQQAQPAHQPRHADRAKCAVRFGEKSGHVFPVDPDEIVEILND